MAASRWIAGSAIGRVTKTRRSRSLFLSCLLRRFIQLLRSSHLGARADAFQFVKRLCYTPRVDESAIDRMLAQAVGAGRTELSEIESKQILEAIGIPVATAYPARNAEEAVELAARVGFPAALKVLSPEAVHKSEVGGVELGLGSPAEVNAAFERIRQGLAAKRPGARFDGVAVQAMAASGLELIVGVTRDDRFGALVIVGLGGVLVEVFKDTALRIAPITPAGARAMLGELRGAALLRGA